jgi:hypothetical protein
MAVRGWVMLGLALAGLGLLPGCEGAEGRAVATVQRLVACEERGDQACVVAVLDLDRKAEGLLGAVYRGARPGPQAAFRELLGRLVLKSITLRKKFFAGGRGAFEAKVGDAGLVTVTQRAPAGDFAFVYLVDAKAGRVLERGHERGGVKADPQVVVRRFVEEWRQRAGVEPTLDDYLKEFEGFVEGRTLRTWKVPGRGKR